MRLIRLLSLTAVALVANASPAVGQRSLQADLRGNLVSAATGEPIAGAFVALGDREFGTYSRRDGRFLLPDMPGSPREYLVEALGYLPATVTLDPRSADVVVQLSPDESLQTGVNFLFAHLDERRNGARLFDREAMAFSGAFDLGELLSDRGVRGVERVCLDEHWAPGLLLEPPVDFYRMEIHGRTARVYSQDFLAQMAAQDSATIRRLVRPEQPTC
jgi:hypothetical protein